LFRVQLPTLLIVSWKFTQNLDRSCRWKDGRNEQTKAKSFKFRI